MCYDSDTEIASQLYTNLGVNHLNAKQKSSGFGRFWELINAYVIEPHHDNLKVRRDGMSLRKIGTETGR